jgi:diguanylate cyclase (GGDEF)-like protein
MLQIGNVQNACWSHYVMLVNMLDCAPTLGEVAVEVDAAIELATGTGNRHVEETIRPFGQLVSVLRGEPMDSPAAEAGELTMLGNNPHAITQMHFTRAVAAVLLDHPGDLERHTAALLTYSPNIGSIYVAAIGRVLRALALAMRARMTEDAERDEAMALLADDLTWLSERAADSRANFAHLLRLVEAEQAWAAGDFHQAAYAFDLAHRECRGAGGARPWHEALILERSARFYLAHGMEGAGRLLLATARQHYQAWGATAKVAQMDWANPSLSVEPSGTPRGTEQQDGARRYTLAAGTIDLLGVVAAAKALSSETTVVGLRGRVVGILSEMTGATGVHLLLRDQDSGGWTVPNATGLDVSIQTANSGGVLPASVVRYAERIREPVVVADATQDDRFRSDPYFAGLERCSLLAVPILVRAELRAMLLLENRLIRGAFSTERLEGIMLIAGQLAVSLDNALVYASLERRVAERTQQLAAANDQLAAANEQLARQSVTDALTGLANRRRLTEVLEAEWDRGAEQSLPLAVAMIDVDHFKRYNDAFGHAAGDRVLRRVADTLAEQAGATADLAARYGGEEFAVVMPATDLPTATRRAEELCQAVAGLAEPHPQVREHVLTVSIGVAATVPTASEDDTPDHLVNRADAALYEAKRAGRSRVISAPATGAAVAAPPR